jgi:O-antigen/teichoic acid export membrane protein
VTGVQTCALPISISFEKKTTNYYYLKKIIGLSLTLNIILIRYFSLIGALVSKACTFVLMTIIIVFYCKANEY